MQEEGDLTGFVSPEQKEALIHLRDHDPCNQETPTVKVFAALLVLFLIGIILAAIGAGELWSLYGGYSVPSSPFGLVIFTSWYVEPAKTGEVDIQVDQIMPETNVANLRLNCAFSTRNNFTEVVFGAQLPYRFSFSERTGSVHVEMWNTELGRGLDVGLGNPVFLNHSVEVDGKTGLSYFWVVVNRSMGDNAYFDRFRFNTTLVLKSPLFQKSYTTYEMINQFDLGIQPEIRSRVPGRGASSFTPANSLTYRLRVARPLDSSIQSSPAADAIVSYEGRLWYQWDVPRGDFGEYSATAISIDFEMIRLIEKRELRLFFASLLLGVGIPLSISSLVECLKLRSTGRGDSKANTKLVQAIG